jgi:hypothetical protein
LKKIVGGALSFFLVICLTGSLFAYEISGEILSVDLDVRAMNVKTRNPFTKKDFFQRLTWVAGSPEGISLRDLKPGDLVHVRADKDGLGRYLVRRIVKSGK